MFKFYNNEPCFKSDECFKSIKLPIEFFFILNIKIIDEINK